MELYNLNQPDNENKDETNPNEKSLGKILSFAISPSKSQIALLNSEGYVFFFHSTLDLDLSKFPQTKVKYNPSPESSEILRILEEYLMAKDIYRKRYL